MKTIAQIINAVRQQDSPTTRCTTLLHCLQTNFQQANASGPTAFTEWMQEYTPAIPELARLVADTASEPQAAGAGARTA